MQCCTDERFYTECETGADSRVVSAEGEVFFLSKSNVSLLNCIGGGLGWRIVVRLRVSVVS